MTSEQHNAGVRALEHGRGESGLGAHGFGGVMPCIRTRRHWATWCADKASPTAWGANEASSRLPRTLSHVLVIGNSTVLFLVLMFEED